jgi:hypothetical protein
VGALRLAIRVLAAGSALDVFAVSRAAVGVVGLRRLFVLMVVASNAAEIAGFLAGRHVGRIWEMRLLECGVAVLGAVPLVLVCVSIAVVGSGAFVGSILWCGALSRSRLHMTQGLS